MSLSQSSERPVIEETATEHRLFGGIEAGGTKFVCAIGSDPDHLEAETTFLTTTPEETISRAIAFLWPHADRLAAIGIGSFGPVDLRPASPTYGYITTTPKLGWAHTRLAGAIAGAFNLPVGFDTDVNAAALGEHRWGAAQGLDTFLYLTVGTGIGGGGMAGGRLLHGLVHPEMGHVRVPRDASSDPFPGCCPYHGDCLEGLASGPALEARWSKKGDSLPPDHEAWALEARYLALALAGFVCTLSPQRLILGGGVMKQPSLLPLIRSELQRTLNGYVQASEILEAIDTYVVPPALGGRAGVLGAIALAQMAAT